MDINILYTKITAFVLRYKWFSFLIIIGLFFLLLISLTTQQSVTPVPTQIQPSSPQSPPPSPSGGRDIDGLTPFNDPRIQKKESLPDGTTKYTKKSDVETRPDISIMKGRSDVFIRSVSSLNEIPSLSSYVNIFGSPAKILQGSKYYGAEAQWYLYTENGLAFVTKNDKVLELHVFYAMPDDEYIKTFGEDIVQQ